MRNSKKDGNSNHFNIIKKDDDNEIFENSTLNGTTLNEGSADSIEDSYQNTNFERETNTLNVENSHADVEQSDEKAKFKKDIKENGLHDSMIDD